MHQVQLSIPEPCHQDWNQMTPTQQGRHCNACAKQVIDFSTMSDAEVLNYFTHIKNENVCGRVYPDQLERTIAMPATPKKRLYWKWNYITMLFLFFNKNNTAKAQGEVKVVTAAQLDNITPVYTNQLLLGKTINSIQTINGTVKDGDGNAIAFATILIKGKNTGLSADANGNFVIKADVKRDILHVSAASFIAKEVALNGITNYNFVLAKSPVESIVMVCYSTKRLQRPKVVVKANDITLEVKDNATMQPVDKALIVIKKSLFNKADTASTDKNGMYLLKGVKDYETCTVEIEAEGYKKENIQLNLNDFTDAKFSKQIFLERKPLSTEYKKLDSVVIKSHRFTNEALYGMIGGMSIRRISVTRTYVDTIKTITTKITGDLKIFPNPVQKGNAINLAFKLKETGAYHIQIINAAGQMLLLKQLQASSKNDTEQVQTNATWSGGVYYVRLLDEKNKLISTNSFLIQ